MSQKSNKPRERKIGNNPIQKKPLIDPRYKNLIYTLVILVTVIIFFIVNNTQSEPASGPYPPNYRPEASKNTLIDKPAPEFELNTIDGKKIKLSDYRNKVVIVDFWATWCGPCRESIPDFVELNKQYKDKGVEIIGVSLDDNNSVESVKPFIKNFGINYTIAYGNQKIVQDYGNINAIPTMFIIDQQGNIAASHVGLVPKNVIEDEIKKLLNKS